MKRELAEILRIVGEGHGRDLSLYDESFITASLERRLTATGLESAVAYRERLSQDGGEVESLFRSLNIGYSEFFRNPLTFAALEQIALPALVEGRGRSGRGEVRVWSAGCAAGQEPYSIAILLQDLTAQRGVPASFRIFATDISEAGLAAARRGVYDVAALQNVRLKHLNNHFSRRGEGYAVDPRPRDRIDFSIYDLVDTSHVCPPASIYGDFDLILCCNLLIYYRPDIRHSILDTLSQCLAPRGYLVTGGAERAFVEGVGGLQALMPSLSIFRKS